MADLPFLLLFSVRGVGIMTITNPIQFLTNWIIDVFSITSDGGIGSAVMVATIVLIVLGVGVAALIAVIADRFWSQ